VTLLEDVVAALRQQSVPHAMIGAAALSAHGISRATGDVDLLTTDARCLTPSTWDALSGRAGIDIRRGDADDPLAGVVRFTRPGEVDVDIVVGRHSWQGECVARAERSIPGGPPIVGLPDLVLLKLYAGGPQDAWDVHQILDLEGGAGVAGIVESRLTGLPRDATDLWRRILGERRR
jgi:hypothetical protein